MVVYKDPRVIKTTSIPNLEGSEVKIYNNLLWGDLEKIYSTESSNIEKTVESLVLLIQDWNLTDEAGKKLPISKETLKIFKLDAILHLLDQTDFKVEELKKNKK